MGLVFLIVQKMDKKLVIGKKYYREKEGLLLKVEIVEVTKNLVFFKYNSEKSNLKVPYDLDDNYAFLTKVDFAIYISKFSEENMNWR